MNITSYMLKQETPSKETEGKAPESLPFLMPETPVETPTVLESGGPVKEATCSQGQAQPPVKEATSSQGQAQPAVKEATSLQGSRVKPSQWAKQLQITQLKPRPSSCQTCQRQPLDLRPSRCQRKILRTCWGSSWPRKI